MPKIYELTAIFVQPCVVARKCCLLRSESLTRDMLNLGWRTVCGTPSRAISVWQYILIATFSSVDYNKMPK